MLHEIAFVILPVFVGLGIALTASAAPQPPPKPPLEEIIPLPVVPGFVGIPGSYARGPGGTVCRTGVCLFAVDDERAIFAEAGEHRYQIRFPRLTAGDIVRVLDGFYRVDTLYSSSTSRPAFVRLADTELPAGTRAMPSTYAFPLGGGGGLHGVELNLPAACPTNDGGNIAITARLSPRAADVPAALREQTVSAGDVLWFGGQGHRVRQIVPPNPEQKLIGWMDIAQKALHEGERQQ